jgi:hypothetical protein
MAFLRFTRDKRGYEHFCLVQPTTNRRGKVRNRILYWFRTPPNVKVGREPFDELLRRALEAQNPDVSFDWQKIIDTPIPSADTEKWRERRRLERAERAARQSDSEELEETPAADVDVVAVAEELSPGEDAAPTDVQAAGESPTEQGQQRPPQPGDPQRRRRRRGRRGRPIFAGAPDTSEPVEPRETPEPLEPGEPPEPQDPQ